MHIPLRRSLALAMEVGVGVGCGWKKGADYPHGRARWQVRSCRGKFRSRREARFDFGVESWAFGVGCLARRRRGANLDAPCEIAKPLRGAKLQTPNSHRQNWATPPRPGTRCSFKKKRTPTRVAPDRRCTDFFRGDPRETRRPCRPSPPCGCARPARCCSRRSFRHRSCRSWRLSRWRRSPVRRCLRRRRSRS